MLRPFSLEHPRVLALSIICLGATPGCTRTTAPPTSTPPQDASAAEPSIHMAPLPTMPEDPPGPVLQNQSFLSNNLRMADSPWPLLEVPGATPQLEELRKWLLSHWKQLRTWPPQFESREEAESVILSWRKLKPKVQPLEEDAYDDVNTTLILSTYHYFGHNLDEADAGVRAGTLIERAISAHPDSPQALALLGFLDLHASPGKSSEPTFLRALELGPDAKLRALINMGLGAACGLAWRPHRSLTYFDKALQESPQLRFEYGDILGVTRERFTPTTEHEWGARQIFAFENDELKSGFFGFSLTLPSGWQVDRASPYEPQRPAIIYLDAPPLEDSGLIHGMVFMPSLKAPLDESSSMLGMMKADGATAKEIAPLVSAPELRRWNLVTSNMKVGSQGDIVQMLYVEATISPEPWSREAHQRAAAEEGNCAPPALINEGPPDEVTVYRHSPLRADSPVHIAITYSASVGTIDRAKEDFTKILQTLKFQNRAGTVVNWP